jgi:hypothetical protein
VGILRSASKPAVAWSRDPLFTVPPIGAQSNRPLLPMPRVVSGPHRMRPLPRMRAIGAGRGKAQHFPSPLALGASPLPRHPESPSHEHNSTKGEADPEGQPRSRDWERCLEREHLEEQGHRVHAQSERAAADRPGDAGAGGPHRASSARGRGESGSRACAKATQGRPDGRRISSQSLPVAWLEPRPGALQSTFLDGPWSLGGWCYGQLRRNVYV